MRRIFADTSYWIATSNKRDSLHSLAKEISKQHASDLVVTTEMVLVEFANFFSDYGQYFRKYAGEFIQESRNNPNIEIEP
jgi:uncharacterized protein